MTILQINRLHLSPDFGTSQSSSCITLLAGMQNFLLYALFTLNNFIPGHRKNLNVKKEKPSLARTYQNVNCLRVDVGGTDSLSFPVDVAYGSFFYCLSYKVFPDYVRGTYLNPKGSPWA